MADQARARRLAKRIVAIVATELEHSVKDPRLAMITITSATVTPDLRDAKVFYTVYGDDLEVEETAKALASATGVLRSAVGRQTGIKFTPTLAFQMDRLPEHTHHIEELLAAAKAADEEVAARAKGAAFAGEADPYRAPRVDEDLDDADPDDEESGEDPEGSEPDSDDPLTAARRGTLRP